MRHRDRASVAEVAGIEVSTDHFIGGERVASAERFDDLSPIDGRVLAGISRGGADEVGGGGRRGARRVRCLGRARPGGRAAYLHRLAELIDANVDRLAAVECEDMAMLLDRCARGSIRRGARNFRAYAELAAAYEERDWSSNGTLNRVHAHAGRPGRGDHALERAVHALDLEDGAGARRRLHGRSSSRPSGRRCRARCWRT